jgi:DNA-directed RNA polymerase specialized sigma24 family protein
MSRTFEELATREIDGLYQGALFLTAGDEDDAENLLLDTLGRSFNRFRASQDVEDISRWLEGRLVSTFLETHPRDARAGRPAAPLERIPTHSHEIFAGLDAPGLHMAAAAVPWAARAALWLVLLRRWPYADASDVMGVDEGVLKDLLRYRHTLMGAILGGLSGKAGARRASGA